MISSDIIRGHNDTIVLSILSKEDSYGYRIAREIETISEGLYPIKETTLYSTFHRLEKNHYIISYFGDETNGKRRTYFKITPEGSRYLQEKCDEWKIIKKVINKFTEGRELNGDN